MHAPMARIFIPQAGSRLVSFAGVLTLAATLSACGGGGGGDNSAAAPATPAPTTTTNTTPTTPVAAPATIVTTPATPTTPTLAEEKAAFTLLNNERNRCGFGLLASNSALDAAAKAHADYMIINNQGSHLEDGILYPTGFTGTDAGARVKAQGYTDAGGVTDEFATFTTSDPAQPKLGLGELGIRALLNAPYHLNGLMSGYRDVGMAVRSNADTGRGARGVILQINAAYKASAGPQQLSGSDVKTYPCDGVAGVNRQLTNESPNPVPGRDLAAQPLGSTVYVAVREGNRLVITSAAMTQATTGQAVLLRTPITGANDPFGPCSSGCFGPHQGYIVPDAPLQPNTGYTVMISGTNNGTAFSRTFTFTTGT